MSSDSDSVELGLFSPADDAKIEKNVEKLRRDAATGHLTATFTKATKLGKIAPRKANRATGRTSPTSALKENGNAADCTESATEKKYALLVTCSAIHVTNVGKLVLDNMWLLSQPVVVIVHGNQDCQAQATSLWLNGRSSAVRPVHLEHK